MSSDLPNELAQASREYAGFKFGLQGNEAAARAFRVRIARLEMFGARARDALAQQLTNANAATRNAAARVLSGMRDPDAAIRLAAAFRRHDQPQLDASCLARLGKDAPLTPSMLPLLDEVRPFERSALVRALFRRQSDEAVRLIEPIFTGFESLLAEAAIDGMATWGDPSWLRDVIARPPMTAPASLPRDFHPVDVRPHAAYYLVLSGDPSALDAVLAWATDSSRARAAQAVLRLAWLAYPDGVAPTAKLLRGRGGEAMELALDAAGIYSSPLLAPELFVLAERRGAVKDDALSTLSWMAEIATEDPLLGRLRTRVDTLDRDRRFKCGVPLTLAALAEDLTSRDSLPLARAGRNLRAITGEDLGFDPDDDLAGNLPAVDAWRVRTRDEAPMGHGGWAFRGQPLPPPSPPSR